MMNYCKNDVSAIIISFNGENIKNVIATLLPQVAHIIIVDNGSEESFLQAIREYDKNEAFSMIYNNENKGQAEALNQGWHKAKELGFKLVLTMDQDSLLASNCVEHLIRGVNAGFTSVGPNYLNKEFNGEYKKVRYLITSGNLIVVDALVEVEGFDSRLFIDSVDFDISLRLRRARNKLAIVKDARMKHAIGEKHINENGQEIYEHSITRHYYIARNHYYIIHKFFWVDPIFCIKKMISYRTSMKELVNESDYEKKIEERRKGRCDSKQLS